MHFCHAVHQLHYAVYCFDLKSNDNNAIVLIGPLYVSPRVTVEFVFEFCFCLDTMDNWDEKKLEEVVNKKHGEAEKKKPKTQIVCTPYF